MIEFPSVAYHWGNEKVCPLGFDSADEDTSYAIEHSCNTGRSRDIGDAEPMVSSTDIARTTIHVRIPQPAQLAND